MKKQNKKIPSGKPSEQVALLNLLKERSGERLTRLEAYLDLVDKAAAQYVPKDLYKQDFSLSQGQFVVTITELAECWHWHRATVRSFIEQLEDLGQLYVQRLPKSQVITISSFVATDASSLLDECIVDLRQKMNDVLSKWRSGQINTETCANLCEHLYTKAISDISDLLLMDENGNECDNPPITYEQIKHAVIIAAIGTISASVLGHSLKITDDTYADTLIDFLEEDLGADWESFIKAAKALADLTIYGSSADLKGESDAVRAQFRSLCKPFLSVLTATPTFSHKTIANE